MIYGSFAIPDSVYYCLILRNAEKNVAILASLCYISVKYSTIGTIK